MSVHASTRCDYCGSFDDHPKVHYARFGVGAKTLHHDCLSADERADVEASSEHGAAIIAAAKSGVHGDDLRTHIAELHSTTQPADALPATADGTVQ